MAHRRHSASRSRQSRGTLALTSTVFVALALFTGTVTHASAASRNDATAGAGAEASAPQQTDIPGSGAASASGLRPYGIWEDLAWDQTADVDFLIQKMADAGVQSVRMAFRWYMIEPTNGTWVYTFHDPIVTKLRAKGIEILGLLEHPPAWATGSNPAGTSPPANDADWQDFVSHVADHYKGQVAAWEVWNEENLPGTFTPQVDVVRYVQMLQVASTAIRAADPGGALVVLGGIAGNGVDEYWEAPQSQNYLQGIYDNGGRNYFDVVAIHPYVHPLLGINTLQAFVWGTHTVMAANGDAAKPLWLTEIGWTIAPDYVPNITEADQANWVRAVYGARALLGADRIFWYELHELYPPPTDVGWGLVRHDLTTRPAYDAYKAVTSAPPTVTAGPSSQMIGSGQTAALSVVATGAEPLTYQWYVGASGNTTNPISDATASSYTTPALTTATSYWVRVSNAFAPASDSPAATITIATPPTVVTSAATSISSSAAMLNATVNPNGVLTTSLFLYGTTFLYGSSWAASSPGSGSSPVPVSAAIAGLTCGTTYHFRASASNIYADALGADATFTTSACSPPTIAPISNATTRVNTPLPVSVTVGSSAGAAGVGLSGTSSNVTVVPNVSLVFSGSGASRTLTITPAPGKKGVTTITVTASDGTGSTNTTFLLIVGAARQDFDGDGKSDVAIYRPNAGTWYLLNSASGNTTYTALAWGNSTDVPVAGDFDGDGKSDVAIYRPASGAWWILKSSTNFTAWLSIPWGGGGTDVPVPGDYDGDGTTDLGIYRGGTWWVLKSSTNFTAYTTYSWGISTDTPVPGDYDGDGTTDIAVYRAGTWWILKSTTNFTAYGAYAWGISTDTPVPGDYDGDGTTDITIYRSASGTWWILKSTTNFSAWSAIPWGLPTDVPVPADYDGDGMTDVAIYRPTGGLWYLLKSSAGFTTWSTVPWGLDGDRPVH